MMDTRTDPLHRMRGILRDLGQPQSSYRTIHLAGTNGKGSTAAFIEAGLRAEGYSTGLYTSPHLFRITDSIRIDGDDIEDDLLLENAEQLCSQRPDQENAIRSRVDRERFEFMTALAFLAFRRAGVEWGVIETGAGGIHDATNVLIPSLSVITPISFDHQHVLGNSLPEIAARKAGILKPGVPAVIAPQEDSVRTVLRERARELDVPIVEVDRDWKAEDRYEERGYYRFTATHRSNQNLIRFAVQLSLAGEHQVTNALSAIAALHSIGLSQDSIISGLQNTRWPGRLEYLEGSPPLLLDGAHNPAGASALAGFLRKCHSRDRICLVFGAGRSKQVERMAEVLFPLAERVILTRLASPAAMNLEELEQQTGRFAPELVTIPSLEEALAAARQTKPALIVVTGSLALAGTARERHLESRLD